MFRCFFIWVGLATSFNETVLNEPCKGHPAQKCLAAYDNYVIKSRYQNCLCFFP